VRNENENKWSLLSSTLILPPFQYFSSRETDFHFYQFLSNFLRYSSLNFLLFYPYNIFTVYFSGNSPLLKSFSSTISNFSCNIHEILRLFWLVVTTTVELDFLQGYYIMQSLYSFLFFILYFILNQGIAQSFNQEYIAKL